MSPLLEARELVRIYETRRGLLGRPSNVRAVDGVSLKVRRGETLGVVGESGSGKSSLGRMLLGIDTAQGGAVYIDGKAMPLFGSPEWRSLRARIQMIYQDPLAALDRRIGVAEQLREPLDIHRIGDAESRMARVHEVMLSVGLRLDQADKFPHELSGGQRQRVVIARALMTEPELLVCDEPVSALDVSIQAQVVNLLADLQRDRGLGMVFISHDLKVVRNLCDRVAVMYLGRIVEEGPADTIFSDPQHPYTQALVSSVPQPGRALNSRIILQGEPPNPGNRPPGCAFHPRCHKAEDICRHTVPETQGAGVECRAACHFAGHAARPELV
ncbi:Oligopeptide transport ATP-binding protein OppF (plasmid) [Sulfitobacter sp. DSM 110093]|uniref:ABC transporter ATP-binding protein n=1 Tax=Sulfitobacter sp. DSM 110093 TaxID=2883127 RepID=UPI001FAB4B81|nr:oligopeptide/dipeptide ABC transporter ATP-binding protein [Sulfitobacter sp. DSM 110093]UOA33690.1 Oligopeptide transport ATP-binding protein OppF [Sulfitobacter sp. DSM 110093]UOA33951.1 Oligopeptide transport ATP-binding protein OppF [Sulfitobacter sp. DSM 110093]